MHAIHCSDQRKAAGILGRGYEWKHYAARADVEPKQLVRQGRERGLHHAANPVGVRLLLHCHRLGGSCRLPDLGKVFVSRTKINQRKKMLQEHDCLWLQGNIHAAAMQ